MHAQSLSRGPLFVTPWTVARQAPFSMGFSLQEYCNGLPFPPEEDLPNPGTKSTSAVFNSMEPLGSPCQLER